MIAPNPPVSEASVTDLESPIQMDVSNSLGTVKLFYKGGGAELSLYDSVAIGNGSQGANPWLQELPDPITKVTWDNYIAMSPMDMAEGFNGAKYRHKLGQNESFDVATVSVNGGSVTLPVFPAPGQKRGTISIALGYGRGAGQEEVGKAAFQTGKYGAHLTDDNGNKIPIGANASGLTSMIDGCVVYTASNVEVTQTGADYQIATTQMHNTVMGRDSIVRETNLDSYLAEKNAKKGEASWNMAHTLVTHEKNPDGSNKRVPTREFDMWKEHPVEEIGHRWGMTIDLSSCLGCGTCVTACHIENNVPVVGKDEVLRHRDMHWLRIDRFFASDYPTVKETQEKKDLGVYGAYQDMEKAAENPQTVHMPMMCQHCNHAPCETVCPVAATTHSNEGLNQMTYNRCIGTRYCANNCPYKVRRFNWFNYAGYKKFQFQNPAQDELTRMVLNPDVVVRSRGVMEKCSMCIQNIQATKLKAKMENRSVEDGEVDCACAEACDTGAIWFGDLNNPNSMVSKVSKNNRAYHALEEVGAKPNVFYMTKVRNTDNNEA
jgi:molybdopterin-containing oxidoreductase family iron-sulfur binding subunit